MRVAIVVKEISDREPPGVDGIPIHRPVAGKLVFITSLRDGNLFIYDATSRKEYKRVAIGHGAAGIQMDPSGARAFVACTPDNYVSVIDLKSLEVSGKVDVGGEPDGLAWAIRP